ncbi:MAG: hypothetical protein LBC74_03670 [Planctomycetaceae bacterium]|jgi:hypothetical protein|nr:hypothetical protein [Planctomycetaceae bacterium]
MCPQICQLEFADSDKEDEGIREYMAMKEQDYAFVKKGEFYYEIWFVTLAALRDIVKSAWSYRIPCFVGYYYKPQIVVIPEMTINAMENAVHQIGKSGMLEHVKHSEQKKLSAEIAFEQYYLKRQGLFKPKESHVSMKNIDKQLLNGIDNSSHSYIDLTLLSSDGKKYQTHWVTFSYLLQEIKGTLRTKTAFCRSGLIIVQNIDFDSIDETIKYLNQARMADATYWDHMLPMSVLVQ